MTKTTFRLTLDDIAHESTSELQAEGGVSLHNYFGKEYTKRDWINVYRHAVHVLGVMNKCVYDPHDSNEALVIAAACAHIQNTTIDATAEVLGVDRDTFHSLIRSHIETELTGVAPPPPIGVDKLEEYLKGKREDMGYIGE